MPAGTHCLGTVPRSVPGVGADLLESGSGEIASHRANRLYTPRRDDRLGPVSRGLSGRCRRHPHTDVLAQRWPPWRRIHRPAGMAGSACRHTDSRAVAGALDTVGRWTWFRPLAATAGSGRQKRARGDLLRRVVLDRPTTHSSTSASDRTMAAIDAISTQWRTVPAAIIAMVFLLGIGLPWSGLLREQPPVLAFENRALMPFPSQPVDFQQTLAWPKQFEAWFSDRAWGRESALAISRKMLLRYAGRAPTERVLIGENGFMFFKGEEADSFDTMVSGRPAYSPGRRSGNFSY